MHPQSLAEEEIKTEQEVVEGMDISTRSKVSDPGPAERVAQKRKIPSPPHSSNGHSPTEPSASPIKKKKNSHNKEQSELRHGPFYYMKQPLTTDPVDVVPQDGRNDFYCWVCHREGQVLCCELCPRVYHAKCLKLTAEPEGDWFCPECEKITVAECIETQSKAMTMLTIDQLSYLLKFALQKMKQPGDQPCSPLSPHAAAHRREPINWTEPFQKPVSLEQHPDYAEYIFHAMDLCTLEKNIKKKMYGCTEAFLADVKWILHNCIIYNGGNHKLTATAKVIIKICEHEMNEIEVCPECYLSACQKRENWFCEPCTNPHPLVWAKLKGFPFWPAKALRDKDGQVDARFFGQHDRAWVPINNCYLMSKEIPFSVKKTKSIFNSAMQEMEIYVDNIGKKFAVFNYAPFRTPYTPNNQFQMLLDPTNPTGGTVRPDKQEKIKFSFDMTASPKIILSKPMLSSGTGRRISLTDMPRSPMSTNSSVHTGSDIEQDASEKSVKAPFSHYSAGEESMDFTDRSTASPASAKMGHAGSVTGSPKPFSSQSSTPIAPKQERTSTTGSILNLNLDRSKAEMDLKELSESVQQQSTALVLTSPKRQIRSRFQLNLDKTIESCKAQLGINEISENAYTGVEHSDSEDSEKSDSSDSEYMSEDEQKLKNGQDEDKSERDLKKKAKLPSQSDVKTEANEESKATEQKTELLTKERSSSDLVEKEHSEKLKGSQHSSKEKLKAKEEVGPPPVGQDMDSDSDGELVIDLGEDHAGRDRKKSKKEQTSTNATKETPAAKQEGKVSPPPSTALKPAGEAAASSLPSLKDSAQTSTITIPINVVSIPATSLTSSTAAAAVKKQRPLLPRETAPAVQRAVVWNSTNKFQTSSQKWHMQKVQRQQQQQNQSQNQQQQNPSPQNTQQQSSQKQTQPPQPPQPAQPLQPQQQQPSAQPSTSTRYQTRQAVKAVQQKEVTQSTSTSSITLVTSTPAVSMITTPVTVSTPSTSVNTDFQIATTSADVAADIAKYTSKIMDAIKGTMTEIYNDLSKSTSGNTIQEIRRLRIEIDKLQWLHQQELSEMKHNLELTMAEMRQSLEQERDRLMAEVKKQTELEKQQAVDETKKKQWCANCKKEAIFYCCWNTSYCDYPCQQAHWPEHMKSCTQSEFQMQVVSRSYWKHKLGRDWPAPVHREDKATASQQEAETETNTGASSKTSQQSASVQPPASETTAAPHEKESSVEKSKDNDTIATGVKSSQPIKLVQVPQTTTFIPNSQPTITIPVVVGPSAGTVAMRTGVQYVQATMPVQVRRV